MNPSESADYVLNPCKPSAKPKAASPIATSKELLDEPAPKVVFEGHSFCFTGVFNFGGGDRNQCEAAVMARGGCCYARPNRDLNYLVVGTFAEPAWAHQAYGRKIETALALKIAGANCKIISEEHWTLALTESPELPKERQTTCEHDAKSRQLVHLQQELQRTHDNQRMMAEFLKRELDPVVFQKLCELLPDMGITPERGRPAREVSRNELRHGLSNWKHAGEPPALLKHGK